MFFEESNFLWYYWKNCKILLKLFNKGILQLWIINLTRVLGSWHYSSLFNTINKHFSNTSTPADWIFMTSITLVCGANLLFKVETNWFGSQFYYDCKAWHYAKLTPKLSRNLQTLDDNKITQTFHKLKQTRLHES